MADQSATVVTKRKRTDSEAFTDSSRTSGPVKADAEVENEEDGDFEEENSDNDPMYRIQSGLRKDGTYKTFKFDANDGCNLAYQIHDGPSRKGTRTPQLVLVIRLLTSHDKS